MCIARSLAVLFTLTAEEKMYNVWHDSKYTSAFLIYNPLVMQ
jgi:hypothetical protein